MKIHWVMSGSRPEGMDWTGGDTVHADTRTLVDATIGEPNFKSIWWLDSAQQAARSVARVKLPTGAATGFLIAKDIFITNNHVFETEQDAKNAKLEFNYRILANGDVAKRDVWKCDTDSLFHTNEDLDYTIVRVKKKNRRNAGDVWGALNLRHGAKIFVNNRVNIIQHPQGRFQEIAFRDNQVKFVSDTKIQYLTDTESGSSGSPVFDDWFNVVALHNQRVSDPNDPFRWYRNQGHSVQAILKDAGDLIP